MTDIARDPRAVHDTWAALPTPAKMEAYERVAPGTADRMLTLVEGRQQHAQRMERLALRIRMMGYLFGLLSVGILTLLGKYYVDAGAATQGTAIVITGAASLAGIFVTGRAVAHRDLRSGTKR